MSTVSINFNFWTPSRQSILFGRGEDVAVLCQTVPQKSIAGLSFQLALKTNGGDAVPLKTWPATLVNAATGSFSFAVGSADTIAFAAGAYIYDVECTTPGQRTVGATGQLNLFQAIGQ